MTRGEGSGEGVDATLMADTRIRLVTLDENSGRMPGVELRKHRNPRACVNEERGHGVCACVQDTLLTDTRTRLSSLTENSDRVPGVDQQKPRNLRVCVSTDLSRDWFYKFIMKR